MSPPVRSQGRSAHSNAFSRRMRLKRKRLIRPLFDRKRSDVHTLAVGCVRLIYRWAPREEVGADVPVQVGFAVGRGVRKAVTRNRLKRIMREVYRVHQHLLVDLFSQTSDALTVMVLFRGDPKQGHTCIPRDLPEALRRLARRAAPSRPPENRA